MKKVKFRQKIRKFKREFYYGKERQKVLAIYFANILTTEIIYLIFSVICTVICCIAFKQLLMSCITILICGNIIIMSPKVLSKIVSVISHFTIKIVFRLSRYGVVITKKDWKKIKKRDYELYRKIWKSKVYYGHCYFFSRALALHLKNAKLLYCSIRKDDEDISHAVILKNGVVFDTNLRMHFDYKEYLEKNNATIYKVFEKEEYCKKDFFDNIREDLIEYCNENDIYCSPQ